MRHSIFGGARAFGQAAGSCGGNNNNNGNNGLDNGLGNSNNGDPSNAGNDPANSNDPNNPNQTQQTQQQQQQQQNSTLTKVCGALNVVNTAWGAFNIGLGAFALIPEPVEPGVLLVAGVSGLANGVSGAVQAAICP